METATEPDFGTFRPTHNKPARRATARVALPARRNYQSKTPYGHSRWKGKGRAVVEDVKEPGADEALERELWPARDTSSSRSSYTTAVGETGPLSWCCCESGHCPVHWEPSWDASCQDSDTDSLVPCGKSAPAPRADLGRGVRLRRRGKLTRELALFGRSAGRWWSDLPDGTANTDANRALAWLRAHTYGQLKVGRMHPLALVGEDGVDSTVHAVEVGPVGPEEATLWVCPQLVAALFTVRCFRALSADLLPSLRSRARLWARDKGMSDLDLSFVLPGSVVLASLPQPGEVVAVTALQSESANWSVDVLGSLSQGVVKVPSWQGRWENFKRVFKIHRSPFLMEPVRDRLSMHRNP
jgi:hypothetical protein